MSDNFKTPNETHDKKQFAELEEPERIAILLLTVKCKFNKKYAFKLCT